MPIHRRTLLRSETIVGAIAIAAAFFSCRATAPSLVTGDAAGRVYVAYPAVGQTLTAHGPGWTFSNVVTQATPHRMARGPEMERVQRRFPVEDLPHSASEFSPMQEPV